jgi:two-component system chemotaxis response regulator CheY
VQIPARILVVDDQQLMRRTLRSLLDEQSHWKIYEATNGRVAVDRLLEIRPDVVVMDILMPVMSGIEAASEVRRLAPDTKVILISSYYTPQEATHLARLFGDGNFIEKSEIGKELVPAISRLLSEESQSETSEERIVNPPNRRGRGVSSDQPLKGVTHLVHPPSDDTRIDGDEGERDYLGRILYVADHALRHVEQGIFHRTRRGRIRH